MTTNKTIGLIGYGLLGKEICQHLLSRGYEVYIFDFTPSSDKNYFQMDICSEQSVCEAINSIKNKGITLNSIVNCSYPRGKNYGAKLEDVSLSSFNENVSLHLGGYFNIMRQFGLYFKENGGGSIISFSSIYGLSAPKFDIYEGLPFTMPVEYAAIKSAILHLNKYMAKYLKGSNVRFNSISPGGIFSNHDAKFVHNYGKYSLASAQGMLNPKDIVSSVEFLVSDGGSHINGQNITIDDGWSL